MKIIVCTMAVNEDYRYIVKYSLRNMDQYCERHGYKFCPDLEEKDTVYDKSRDPPWFKIQVVKKILLEQKDDCDYCVWIDADTHILKREKKFEELITNYMGEDKHVLMTREGRACNTTNTGVMIFKNSETSIKLLDEIWNNKAEFDQNFHEQASFNDLYDRNVNNCQSYCRILEPYLQAELFSFWFMHHPGQTFIMHAARCSGQRESFIYTLDAYCPIKMDEETEDQYNARLNWLNTDRCRQDIDKWLKGEYCHRVPSARNKH